MEKQPQPHSCKSMHVVGIGASAGGLKAIEAFFEAVPTDTGAAFVVIQHLSPDFKSHMAELLARRTRLAIFSAEDGMELEPDTVYLMPPNKEMIVSEGRLRLSERNQNETPNLPIDQFLHSLAIDFGSHAIGVVLSGTGSDGSRGIIEVNQGGGLVLCQDEASAEFDGMPLNAQETNAVHLVLHPVELAHAISTYLKQSLTPETLSQRNLIIPAAGDQDEIVKLLRRDHGIDFSLYKPTTVRRRIERRLALGGYSDVESYVDRLRSDPEELNSLYMDLLIGVTQFFRDREAFDQLEHHVVPEIIKKKLDTGESIRIWVAGCASGEEAVSIAILFAEAIEQLDEPLEFKIFATDVHRSSLAFASTGRYSKDALGNLSSARLERFFERRGDRYELKANIRRKIVFAPHNLITDAPFTRLDLVSCRNLLIYFQPAVQKKSISLFHFSLRSGGYLILGPSETPGDLVDEFDVIHKKWRIYRKRRDVRLTVNPRVPIGMPRTPTIKPPPREPRRDSQLMSTYDRILDQVLPPSFLVDEHYQLLHVFAGGERYLKVRGGRISTDVLSLVQDDLKTPLSGALQHAAKEDKEVLYSGIQLGRDGHRESINLVVRPFGDPKRQEIHRLVSMEPAEQRTSDRQPSVDVDVSQMSRDHIESLEDELRYTKENLQATVEELETSNEELQATNEELVASNEEMQSTNEELQSVNEELYTVNAEHQQKIAELTQMTNDLNNLFLATDVGVIFLDNELKIRRYTPRISETFDLLPQDIGRSIESFSHSIDDPHVFSSARQVLETGVAITREVRDNRKNHWLLKIAPCRTETTNRGIVLTMVDINSIRRRKAYQEIIDQTSDFVATCEADGSTMMINPAGAKMLGLESEQDWEGRPFDDWFVAGESGHLLEEAIPHAIEHGVWRGNTLLQSSKGPAIPLSSVIIAHKDRDGKTEYISTVGRDISAHINLEQQLESEKLFLRRTLDGLFAFVGVLTVDGSLIEANRTALEAAGLELSDVVDQPFEDTWWWSYSPEVQQKLRNAISKAARGEESRYDVDVRLKDESYVTIDFQLMPLRDQEGNVTHLIPSGIDITDRKEIESEMRVFRRAFQSSLTAMVITDARQEDNPIVYVNPGFEELTGYSGEEVIGKNCRFLQGPATDKAIVEKVHHAIDRGENISVRLLNYRKSGEHFFNQLVITPVKDRQGEITHFVGVQFDMTNFQEAEQKLVEARDYAEAANAAKSAFVANISHEIRTPLTTVVGMTEMLLEQEEDSQRRKTLQMIHRSGNHLVNLINDVLDLSKIEAGRLEADLIECSPVEIIRDISASLQYRASNRGLGFEVSFATEVPSKIKTDPIRFRQILFNLAGNAVKFTDKGSVKLRVSMSHDLGPDTLRVDVIDTGIGFDSETAARLFEPFSQGDDTPARKQGGTGLGLYISRRIADVLGGRIEADSTPGQGSVFSLMLPVPDLQNRSLISPDLSDSISQPKRVNHFKVDARVLIAEDTRGIQMLLKRILTSAGAEVVTANDGVEAIELFQPHGDGNGHPGIGQFDLILLDMHMPRSSGYEVASRLREMGVQTPIIALTASALRGDREKCLAAGCTAYLTKPIDRQALLSEVTRLLANHQAQPFSQLP